MANSDTWNLDRAFTATYSCGHTGESGVRGTVFDLRRAMRACAETLCPACQSKADEWRKPNMKNVEIVESGPVKHIRGVRAGGRGSAKSWEKAHAIAVAEYEAGCREKGVDPATTDRFCNLYQGTERVPRRLERWILTKLLAERE